MKTISEIFDLVSNDIVFIYQVQYHLKSGTAFSLFLYLFLIKIYEENAVSTNSVLINSNRNSIALSESCSYSFLIFIQKLISCFLLISLFKVMSHENSI
jgi:hypothetical protein